MPGIVMLVLRVTLPASSGWPVSDVNSRTKALGPGCHVPASLLRVITASLVFWVCTTLRSAAHVPIPPASTSTTSSTAVLARFMSRLLLIGLRWFSSVRGRDQLALPEPVEDNRRHDQHQQERAHHPAQHGRRQRLHHLGARRVAPHDW